MRPFCATCGKWMKPYKTGAQLLEKTEDGSDYRIISCDAFQCEQCYTVVLCGFASRAVEWWEDGFLKEKVAMVEGQLGIDWFKEKIR